MKRHEFRNSKLFYILFVIAAILVLSQVWVIVATKEDTTTFNQSWECIQTECSQFMTTNEIVESFCFVNNESMMLCKINVDDQQYEIPLAELDLSAFQICKEFSCVKEALVRPVDYVLNVTESTT